MAKRKSTSDYIIFAVIGLMALTALFVAVLPIISGFGGDLNLFDDGWEGLGKGIADFNVVYTAYLITFIVAIVAAIIVAGGYFMNNSKIAQLGMLAAIVAGVASIVGLIFTFIACGNKALGGTVDTASGAIIATILAVIGALAASYKLMKR